MKVSIVTISYNQANFLQQTIESVLSQDYLDIEYIVVDAGSTDGSREIIEKYKDKISKIIFEGDNGPADGLNKGFSFAKGHIFGFINSDDLLLPGAVSRVVQGFSEDDDIEVLYGNALKINTQGEQIGYIISDRLSALKYLYGVFTFAQPSVFFKSKAFHDVGGFNASNKICWDGELFLQFALAKKKALRKADYFSAFRVYSDSISKSKDYLKKYKTEQARIFKEIKKRERNKFDSIIRVTLLIAKQFQNPLKPLVKAKLILKLNGATQAKVITPS